MPKCSACSSENSTGARFCSSCGAEVKAAATRIEPEHMAPGVVLQDRYKVTGQQGVEGTGPVWIAADQMSGDLVAIKVLPRIVTESPASMAEIQERCGGWLKLDHPNIVPLRSLEMEPFPFLVCDMVEARNLKDVYADRVKQGHEIHEVGHFTVGEVITFLPDLVAAIDHGHALGVLHLDIQPKNILLMPREGGGWSARLTNFGVTGFIRDKGVHPSKQMRQLDDGVPVYMAPEQMRLKEVDGRSDLYCVAVVVFHLLTGQHPFLTRSQIGLAGSMPRAPKVDTDILGLLHLAMSVRPGSRPESGQAFFREFMLIADPDNAPPEPGVVPEPAKATPPRPGPAADEEILQGSGVIETESIDQPVQGLSETPDESASTAGVLADREGPSSHSDDGESEGLDEAEESQGGLMWALEMGLWVLAAVAVVYLLMKRL